MRDRIPFAVRGCAACAIALSASFAQDPLFRRLDGPIEYPDNVKVVGIGDLTLDGAAEVVFSDGIGLNDGTGRIAWIPWVGPQGSEDSAIGDFNGDLLPDFAGTTSGASPSSLRLPFVAFGAPAALLGSAVPGLSAPLTVGVALAGLSARSVDAGDIDGDGDLDLMWLGQNPSNQKFHLVLWVNDGVGGFSPSSSTVLFGAASEGTSRFVDVDLDGDLDAVVFVYSYAGYGGGVLLVSINSGGAFAAPSWVPTWGLERRIAVGDVDGDGASDVLVYANGQLQICLATPAGLVVGPLVSGAGGSFPVLADFDANGAADLVEFSVFGGVISAFGPSGAVAAPLAVEAHVRSVPEVPIGRQADLDGDGDVDLLVATPTSLGFWMNGGGAPTRVLENRFGVTAHSDGFEDVFGDFDADGATDRVSLRCDANTGTTTLRLSLNDGHGFFEPAGETSFALACGGGARIAFDRDGDGDDDLLLGGASAAAPGDDVVVDNAAGTFSVVGSIPGSGSSRAQRADLDGDGDHDVLLHGLMTQVFIRYGDHGTGLSAPVALGPPTATLDTAVGDFDDDGDPDVLVLFASTVGGGATLWRNDGGPPNALVWTSVAQPAMVGAVGLYAAAGRFNSDAFLDVACGVFVYLGGPGGVFTAGPNLSAGIGRAATAADLDGDGLDDIVESFGSRRTCLGSGVFGPLTSAFQGSYFANANRPLVQDWDRDGDVDALHFDKGYGPVLLLNTTRQLSRGAVARPGRNASLDLFGAPGGHFTLFASTGPASLGAGPWGTVLIDPANAVLAAAGAYPAVGPSAGRTSLSFAVPNYPAFVGLSLYWQAVDDATFHVTNRMVTQVYGF